MPTTQNTYRPASTFQAIYPYFLLILCGLCWASVAVLARAVRNDMPPFALGFWRWALVAVILAPVALPRLKGKYGLVRRHLGLIALLGFFGGAFFHSLIYLSVHYTEAINATLMNAATPITIMAMSWLFDREKVTTRQFTGMWISVAGIFVIVARGDFRQLLHLQFNIGDLIILIAMLFWGFYSVLYRRLPKAFDGMTALFLIAVFGLIIGLPPYLVEVIFFQNLSGSPAEIAVILYTGFFATFLAYVFWNKGLSLVGPNKTGMTVQLIPVFGTIMAVLFLGEQFHPFHAVAIVIVLFGVWLATSARRPPPPQRVA